MDGELCNTTRTWTGKVVRCQRGTSTFAEQFATVANHGALAAVIYNNVAGSFISTRGTGGTTSMDLGARGRDTSDGYGLVQTQKALTALTGLSKC